MTEQAFDVLLRKALMEAVMEDLGPVWDGELPADPQSPRQRRRMLRLLRDPCRVVRRRARPVWKRGLRAAVCAVIISAALFAATIAAVPQARAWVKELWSQWFETHTKYEFTGEPSALNTGWDLNYLPIGYKQESAYRSHGVGAITYIDDGDNFIYFDYKPIQDGTSFSVDNEHSDYKLVYLEDGTAADLYRSNTDGKANCLIWATADMTTGFQLMAKIPTEELISMAENITPLID